MPSWGDLLGEGSVARQFLLWGVAYQVAQVLLGPTEELARQELFKAQPVIALSPAQVADMVLKNIMSEGEGEAEAVLSGIDSGRFAKMVLDAGEPPGIQDLLLMYRRGIIPEGTDVPGSATLRSGIRESRLRDEWTDAVIASRVVPISTSAAVDAVLRNQTTAAAGEQIAYENGILQTDFDLLVNTSGNPPSVTELLELMRRGIIPAGNLDPASKVPNPAEISFAQGIYEGDSKDKWLPYYAKLAEYIPPPRTVTALLREGVITAAEAAQLFQDAGLTPALADAYVASASHAKTAAAKNLNESAVVELYVDKLIDGPTATTYLEKLGYDANEAGLILSTADYKSAYAALKGNTAKIGTYFVGHKISEATARAQLAGLGLPAAQVDQLVAGWLIDRSANVRLLTAAQVTSAWEYAVITQDEAMAALEADGYTPFDAWVILSDKNKAPLPGKPAQGPGPLQ